MKNEADFKRMFKQAITLNKGYCVSLAAPAISGLPDLFVTYPGHIPFMLEAKWLGEVKKLTFKRKINYSPLQKHFLTECNKVNNHSAFGLIGVKFGGVVYAVMTDFHVTELTHDFEFRFPHAIYSPVSKRFELESMIKNWNIPKINYDVHTTPVIRTIQKINVDCNFEK